LSEIEPAELVKKALPAGRVKALPEAQKMVLAIFFYDVFQIFKSILVEHRQFSALKRAFIRQAGGNFKKFGVLAEKTIDINAL
jgi:hypothetical protein